MLATLRSIPWWSNRRSLISHCRAAAVAEAVEAARAAVAVEAAEALEAARALEAA
jgi:hypothetical protein